MPIHPTKDPSTQRRGFSLLELIVTLSIIGLLIALLAPAIQSSRRMARRAECQNNLKQIGIAFSAYLAAQGSGARFPRFPSRPGQAPPAVHPAHVLAPYGADRLVWKCPVDSQYFPAEGTSYEYNPSLADATWQDLTGGLTGTDVPAFREYEGFHWPAGRVKPRLAVTTHGRVEFLRD